MQGCVFLVTLMLGMNAVEPLLQDPIHTAQYRPWEPVFLLLVVNPRCQSCNDILGVAVHVDFRMLNVWGKLLCLFFLNLLLLITLTWSRLGE